MPRCCKVFLNSHRSNGSLPLVTKGRSTKGRFTATGSWGPTQTADLVDRLRQFLATATGPAPQRGPQSIYRRLAPSGAALQLDSHLAVERSGRILDDALAGPRRERAQLVYGAADSRRCTRVCCAKDGPDRSWRGCAGNKKAHFAFRPNSHRENPVRVVARLRGTGSLRALRALRTGRIGGCLNEHQWGHHLADPDQWHDLFFYRGSTAIRRMGSDQSKSL